jgi:hypothetical protein
MPKFIKKPIVIEAIEWTGDNSEEIQSFIGNSGYVKGDYIDIGTLEGIMVASKGDMIIKGINGEFYPCKPDIFKKTYYTVQD